MILPLQTLRFPVSLLENKHATDMYGKYTFFYLLHGMFACITEVRSSDSYNVIIVKVVIDFSYFLLPPGVLIMQTYKNRSKILFFEIQLDLSRILQWAKVDNNCIFSTQTSNWRLCLQECGKGPHHSTYSLIKRKQIFHNSWKVKFAPLTTLKTMLDSAWRCLWKSIVF